MSEIATKFNLGLVQVTLKPQAVQGKIGLKIEYTGHFAADYAGKLTPLIRNALEASAQDNLFASFNPRIDSAASRPEAPAVMAVFAPHDPQGQKNMGAAFLPFVADFLKVFEKNTKATTFEEALKKVHYWKPPSKHSLAIQAGLKPPSSMDLLKDAFRERLAQGTVDKDLHSMLMEALGKVIAELHSKPQSPAAAKPRVTSTAIKIAFEKKIQDQEYGPFVFPEERATIMAAFDAALVSVRSTLKR